MATFNLFNNSVEISEAVSGAYEFLRDQNGHTGSFVLKGGGFAEHLSCDGLGVNGFLNVTGSSQIQENLQIDGDLTGYNDNNLANLVVTGTTDITQFINGIDVSGDSSFNDSVSIINGIDVSGDSFFTGSVDITDGLTVNGSGFFTGSVDITGGLTVNGSGLNDFGSDSEPFSNFLDEGIGQLYVGTGLGQGTVLTTDGAQSGWAVVYNPANPIGLEFQLVSGSTGLVGVGGGGGTTGLTYFDESITNGTQIVGLSPSFENANPHASVNISPKGSGAFFISPTGLVDPENELNRARGSKSVDLQIAKDTLTGYSDYITEATQSAILGGKNSNIEVSGVNSVIIGGVSSYINSANSAIVAGAASRITYDSPYCFIGSSRSSIISRAKDSSIIGSSNAIGDNLSAISGCFIVGESNTLLTNKNVVIGTSNSISNGENSIALGRDHTKTSSEQDTTIIGYKGTAHRYGELSQSAGVFSGSALTGNPRRSSLLARGITTNATQTNLYLDGSSKNITINARTTSKFNINIVARRTDGGGEQSAAYQIKGLIQREGTNSAAIVGSTTVTTIAEDVAGWDVTAEADTTTDSLVIKVTGEGGSTIRWAASVDLIEVSDL